jgi:DNA-binding response OmpR family regulator
MEASSDGISERPIIFVVENLRKPRPRVARSLLSTPYHVVAAAHLMQAIRMLKLLRQRPALAIVDLHDTPGSGRAVARTLSRHAVNVPIIFVVKHLADPDTLLPGLVLEKPLNVPTLCRVVENVLARRAPLFSSRTGHLVTARE